MYLDNIFVKALKSLGFVFLNLENYFPASMPEKLQMFSHLFYLCSVPPLKLKARVRIPALYRKG